VVKLSACVDWKSQSLQQRVYECPPHVANSPKHPLRARLRDLRVEKFTSALKSLVQADQRSLIRVIRAIRGRPSGCLDCSASPSRPPRLKYSCGAERCAHFTTSPRFSSRILTSFQRTWYGPLPAPMLCTCKPMKPAASSVSLKSAHATPLTHERMRSPWATIR
jgi:hypothetical protein